ncbi:hypothetical protein [Legionella tunisiensis]|uniref:hypothetical protein n=1 Tax=Legionella tunisiensis TaxID=1034944 RepID=UPI00031F7954|nr:hypothetical protein [Legionella tunisiensis]
MKWIALTPAVLLLTACGCCTNSVAYQEVNVAPVVATPVYYPTPAYYSRPVYYDSAVIIDNAPVDVTTTTIEYY